MPELQTAPLNSKLILGGRVYLRGDHVELEKDDIEFLQRRGTLGPVTKRVQPLNGPPRELEKGELTKQDSIPESATPKPNVGGYDPGSPEGDMTSVTRQQANPGVRQDSNVVPVYVPGKGSNRGKRA